MRITFNGDAVIRAKTLPNDVSLGRLRPLAQLQDPAELRAQREAAAEAKQEAAAEAYREAAEAKREAAKAKREAAAELEEQQGRILEHQMKLLENIHLKIYKCESKRIRKRFDDWEEGKMDIRKTGAGLKFVGDAGWLDGFERGTTNQTVVPFANRFDRDDAVVRCNQLIFYRSRDLSKRNTSFLLNPADGIVDEDEESSFRTKQAIAECNIYREIFDDFVLPSAARLVSKCLRDSGIEVFSIEAEERLKIIGTVFDENPEEMATRFWRPVKNSVCFEAMYNPPRWTPRAQLDNLDKWKVYNRQSFIRLMDDAIMHRVWEAADPDRYFGYAEFNGLEQDWNMFDSWREMEFDSPDLEEVPVCVISKTGAYKSAGSTMI